ncbi:PapB/FocB family fimbrial expression transcriptional regulator, partial [Escherichia coli]|uniref:PapB/FocB family fimbrial expression transcriptional regulator n=1 Tax=Escherichia coli TaxID=562 RepID=UPI003EE34A45
YPRNNFNTELIQSCMNGEHFSLLIEISPIRSKKNIMALKEYLIVGNLRSYIDYCYSYNILGWLML